MVENIFYSDNTNDLPFKLEEKKTHKALLTSYGSYEFFLKNECLFKKIISNQTNNVFIISEAKSNFLINISNHNVWKIFNKNIKVNLKILKLLKTLNFINIDDKLIENDHKIEITLNFISNIKENIKIIPIIFGKTCNKHLLKFCEFLKPFINREENSFIFLSCFISKSTNIKKALKFEENLKHILLEKELPNLNLILENYKSKKIFPENINAIMTISSLFKHFEFTDSKITFNSPEYLISSSILIR
ncbi:AmmeMemoRadiSam system protein B [Borreliella burgdorferi]|uniref:AmmeMemoRadiSam system protein B n=1 Tax=Borreliella burgdorferi TaxID=139 RepID=UPI000D0453A5|nr:AmmeMemoRadiSam system protein B [Borreliella burgdorferi]MCD2330764.1 AmmeMemoRadiSam system protein B [Borreliella burgdorferi]MCD2407970.1 AmmeMemoRadiSam system protein B [Borreliella burgdorferi]PRQ96365.1 AmmeMemoRadiSam system protein B [Borreliella burgdorferi]PRR40079.1 AmmeMemoRadiSam system protein B [Borreliella burgdorferi]